MEMKTGLTNTIFRLMVSFLPDIITIPYVHCSRLTSVLYEINVERRPAPNTAGDKRNADEAGLAERDRKVSQTGAEYRR